MMLNRLFFLLPAVLSWFGNSIICYAQPAESLNWFDPTDELDSDHPDFEDTYPNMTAVVGEQLTFLYSVIHNVYILPSQTCANKTGRIRVGAGSDAPRASYTFTEADEGKDLFFACIRGSHCEQGQNMFVKVLPADTTSAPTPFPTFGGNSDAEGNGDIDAIGVCFAGDMTVDVMGRGETKMENLKLGDMVNIGNNQYSKVYSFGHKDSTVKNEYLQIHFIATHSRKEKSLKISKRHMLFVKGEEDVAKAVPASIVKAGDELILSNGEHGTVSKTTLVWGRGAYAPFTMSGTVAVNGVIASSYVSLQQENNSEFLVIGNWKTPFSIQWLSHAFQTHHRLTCRWNADFCNGETYTQDGISSWVYHPMIIFSWILSQPISIMALFLPLFVGIAASLSTFEFVAMMSNNNNGFLLFVLAACAFLVRMRGQRSKKMMVFNK